LVREYRSNYRKLSSTKILKQVQDDPDFLISSKKQLCRFFVDLLRMTGFCTFPHLWMYIVSPIIGALLAYGTWFLLREEN
ncbi:MAG: hypothetical protein RJQ34_04130, partial [Balneola sp.]